MLINFQVSTLKDATKTSGIGNNDKVESAISVRTQETSLMNEVDLILIKLSSMNTSQILKNLVDA